MTDQRDELMANSIDRYVDGLMTASQRSEFEQRLANDPALRDALERQSRVDASLKRLFTPPAPDRALAGMTDRREPAAGSSSTRRHVLALAAAIAVAAVGGWRLWGYFYPPLDPLKRRYEFRDFATIYGEERQFGFKPNWVCKGDQEFQETFAKRLGQPLLLGETPADVSMLGLSYGYSITEDTVYMLGRADGRDVVVFFDRAAADQGQSVGPSTGLHLFHRTVGDLVLYELTPLPQSRFLDAFYVPRT